ncbi:MAG: Flp pilus assembly complex ATPase component TadA [Marinospirillum sp.]|uniref:ATPase, T2SS/T4P/T4SS family n=1 Tax=Marinospirillum sp. TaxID=2183934 RepID=UPI001A09A81D|nr:ATPase, T2SS/T4P/T4SS family [Marinospirillum sp.]MBE0506578.1 Flp pilus assembly complex ATPase component TadA [Marinospirillum sp.]
MSDIRLSNERKTTAEDLEEILYAYPDSSDIFLQTGQPIRVMLSKRIIPLTDRPLQEAEVRALLTIIGDNDSGLYDNALSSGDPKDSSYVSKTGERFRVAMVRDASRRGMNLSVVMRRIESDPWPLERLRLPPGLLEMTRSRRPGLILVNGPTGSGKTSLLSGLLNDIVCHRDSHAHLYTVESPVEYVFYKSASISAAITQAEVGKSCSNFASGVRNAMRMRPTHILIGEIRDPETARAAIAAARTGHTVFATMHTSSVPEIFQRWTDFFPDNQRMAMAELSGSILYAVYQTLERMPDGRLMPIQEYLDFDYCGERGDLVEQVAQNPSSTHKLIGRLVKEHGCTHKDDWENQIQSSNKKKNETLLQAVGLTTEETKKPSTAKECRALDYL